MTTYDEELLKVARRLLVRPSGQRGKLPSARVRRSISTSYYALFHVVLDEVGLRVVGTHNNLRRRRRLLSRTITHKAAKATFDKVRGRQVERSVEDFFLPNLAGGVTTPSFIREFANAFLDAQAKRLDADYDMNKHLSEIDARLLRLRVKRVITQWRSANSLADKDFKHALCILVLLKGQLRPEN